MLSLAVDSGEYCLPSGIFQLLAGMVIAVAIEGGVIDAMLVTLTLIHLPL